MDFKDFTAGRDDDSRRLDRIVKRILEKSPEINCHEIIRKKLVRLNQKKASSDSKVHEGDVISVAAFLLEKNSVESAGRKKNLARLPEIRTVFENEHVLVVYKPRGISVQPSSSGETSLCEIISGKNSGAEDSISFRSGPLHRIDRNTSGMVAFSRSLTGAKWFSEALQDKLIKKTYLGISEGKLEKSVSWEDFISDGESISGFYRVKVVQDGDSGKKAVTHARPVAYGKKDGLDITLIEYRIDTGRKHQIRCQSAFHGHPLLGDNAYGGHGSTFYLHAAKLEFPEKNPLGLPPILECPIPDDFKKIIDLNLIKSTGQLIIF